MVLPCTFPALIVTEDMIGPHTGPHSSRRKGPQCDSCGGLLKPATISFGQAMPERETAEAFRRSADCDVFIVIGSSLVVYPAAQMPVVAKQSGAKLVIVNRDETACDKRADVIINGQAGTIMAAIVKVRVREGVSSKG